jgi:hypothetical protein
MIRRHKRTTLYQRTTLAPARSFSKSIVNGGVSNFTNNLIINSNKLSFEHPFSSTADWLFSSYPSLFPSEDGLSDSSTDIEQSIFEIIIHRHN